MALITDIINSIMGKINTHTTKLASIEEGAQVNTVTSVNGKTGVVTIDSINYTAETVLSASDFPSGWVDTAGNNISTTSFDAGSYTLSITVPSVTGSTIVLIRNATDSDLLINLGAVPDLVSSFEFTVGEEFVIDVFDPYYGCNVSALSLFNGGAILFGKGDGTKYLSDDGTYKTPNLLSSLNTETFVNQSVGTNKGDVVLALPGLTADTDNIYSNFAGNGSTGNKIVKFSTGLKWVYLFSNRYMGIADVIVGSGQITLGNIPGNLVYSVTSTSDLYTLTDAELETIWNNKGSSTVVGSTLTADLEITYGVDKLIEDIISISGDGTKYLSDDGTYKDVYTKEEIDNTIDSVNLLRADKYLASQNIANMVYTAGDLTKIQYNNATDVDYETLTYTSGSLTSINHYVNSVLAGTSTLSYTAGALTSVIFEEA